MEKTAPEAYIIRRPFGETVFKLDLSVFKPSTETTFSKLDAIGQIEFRYCRSSKEIVPEANTEDSSDHVMRKIMREEPETEPGCKDE